MKSALCSARYERMKRAFPDSSRKAGVSDARQRGANSMEAGIALINTHFSFFVRSLMAMPCQLVKKTLASRWAGKQSVFALENEIFRAAIVPHPPCTPPDAIGYSKGFRLFALSEVISTVFRGDAICCYGIAHPQDSVQKPFLISFKNAVNSTARRRIKIGTRPAPSQRNFSRHCLCSASASLWYSR